MKKFNEFVEIKETMNNSPRPGGTINDRSLEAFPQILDQLMMIRKSILSPEAKQMLSPLIVNFNNQMQQALQQLQSQGTGFSPRYVKNQNPLG